MLRRGCRARGRPVGSLHKLLRRTCSACRKAARVGAGAPPPSPETQAWGGQPGSWGKTGCALLLHTSFVLRQCVVGCALLAAPLQAAFGVLCVCVCVGLETFVSNYAGFLSWLHCPVCPPSSAHMQSCWLGMCCTGCRGCETVLVGPGSSSLRTGCPFALLGWSAVHAGAQASRPVAAVMAFLGFAPTCCLVSLVSTVAFTLTA